MEEENELTPIDRKMDYFYQPYRVDLFKEQETFMSFKEKSNNWTAIADGIIGKNLKIKKSFSKALKRLSSYENQKAREFTRNYDFESTIKAIKSNSLYKRKPSNDKAKNSLNSKISISFKDFQKLTPVMSNKKRTTIENKVKTQTITTNEREDKDYFFNDNNSKNSSLYSDSHKDDDLSLVSNDKTYLKTNIKIDGLNDE